MRYKNKIVGCKMTEKELYKELEKFAKNNNKIKVITELKWLLNSLNYYADSPKDTKQFWVQFAKDCIANDFKSLKYIESAYKSEIEAYKGNYTKFLLNIEKLANERLIRNICKLNKI